MLKRNQVKLIVAIMVITFFLSACNSSALPTGKGAVWHLVILSDSSLWGVGEAFAAKIEQDLGVSVVVEDYAMGGSSAGQVLDVLLTGKSPNSKLEKLPSVLAEAEVVVMFLNPNDSINHDKPLNLDGCFFSMMPAACEPETFEQWTKDLQSIWGEILRLRQGKKTILRAVDMYNPLVSPWKENGVFESCNTCWENMSFAVQEAADAYGIPVLNRLDAFNGVNHEEDPRLKGYIAPDGEHLTDLGAQYTAELLAKMGYEPVLEE